MSLQWQYKQLLDRQHLRPDPRQKQLVAVLDAFAHQLEESVNAKRWLFFRNQAPQSLYLYGAVGRGKTMLMDLLFDTIRVPKKRYHFNEFMLWLHEELKRHQGIKNPLAVIAQSLADQTSLLCFDEFQVRDIADAMLLGRFFDLMLDSGVVLCVTSNIHPSELYADGLQRERFMPVINRLTRDFSLLPLFDGGDYRRSNTLSTHRYFTPANTTTNTQILVLLSQLQTQVGVERCVVRVLGRQITSLAIFRQAKAIAFHFDALCATARSAADYRELARQWPNFALLNIPQLSDDHADALQRFIVLVDQLYEHQCACFFSSNHPIDQLYTQQKMSVPFARCASRLYSLQHFPLHLAA